MGLFDKLKSGLKKTSDKFSKNISQLITGNKISDSLLEDLSDILIMADLGQTATNRLIDELRQEKFGEEMGEQELRQFLANKIADNMQQSQHGFPPIQKNMENAPHVMLVVGVNGSGKTTSIAKLAQYYKGQGLKILLVAGDRFRAAAVEQLEIWGRRLDIEVMVGNNGGDDNKAKKGDAAGLIFDSYSHAANNDIDLIIIDTAGRLHNQVNLMAELSKICRVLQKKSPDAPHDTVLVLDATTGQNAVTQVEMFMKTVPINQLIMSKLDGSSKGGILVSIHEKFQLPVMAIGIGEKAEDLQEFNAENYARALLDVE